MKELKNYTNDYQIIYILCRMRAKLAQLRSKKHVLHEISTSAAVNYHQTELTKDEIFLKSVMPRRSDWKRVKKVNRYKLNGQKVNGLESNISSLLITIAWHRKNNPGADFLQNLDRFILDVRESIFDRNYKIGKPEIYPKLKEQKKTNGRENTCRPICHFQIKDKIVIGIVNRYLTDLFDRHFYDYSLAFKSAKIVNGKNVSPTHHDAITEILSYKKKITQDALWVSESDMNKFFDSVSHLVIKRQFNKLVNKVARLDSCKVNKHAIRVFNSYLKCYNFVRDVLPKNGNKLYWKDLNIPNGKYGWVEKELIQLKYYKRIGKNKIGIPQGGALSGLIANIVLDYADQKLKKENDDNLGYFRFCDDMILIHPEKTSCTQYVKKYVKSLRKLKLVPHPFSKEELTNSADSFWSKNVKSKAPYKWSSDHTNSFPWIGFVGYEIHFDESLRVRKSSLKKELLKQKNTINQFLKHIKTDRRDGVRNRTIIEKAAKSLHGMSIGRGDLWNMNVVENEMCWVKGYSKLTVNKHTIKQVKLLDWHRVKQIKKLKKEVMKFNDTAIPAKPSSKEARYTFYGKPFSYYYHVIDRKKDLH